MYSLEYRDYPPEDSAEEVSQSICVSSGSMAFKSNRPSHPIPRNQLYMSSTPVENVISLDRTSQSSFNSEASTTFNKSSMSSLPHDNSSVYVPETPAKRPPASRGRKRKGPAPIHPNPIQEVPIPQSQMRGRDGDPPQAMTGQLKLKITGYGHGNVEDAPPPAPPAMVKGRAGRQGMKVDIPNPLRDQAIAVEKAKRTRFNDDEAPDTYQEDRLKAFNINDNDEPVVKRAKTGEGQKTRAHHACDRCWRSKTRVSP
jgi:hypothetical protein